MIGMLAPFLPALERSRLNFAHVHVFPDDLGEVPPELLHGPEMGALLYQVTHVLVVLRELHDEKRSALGGPGRLVVAAYYEETHTELVALASRARFSEGQE